MNKEQYEDLKDRLCQLHYLLMEVLHDKTTGDNQRGFLVRALNDLNEVDTEVERCYQAK